MVLPLLGILGLGATAAAAPHWRNYEAKTRGNYNQGVIDGTDPNDPSATRNALFGGGLLDPQQFQADSRKQFEGMAQRAQSDTNSRRAAGTAAARLAFDREQVEQARQAEEARAVALREETNWTVNEFGNDAQKRMAQNPFMSPQGMQTLIDDIRKTAGYDVTTDPQVLRTTATQDSAAAISAEAAQVQRGFDLEDMQRTALAAQAAEERAAAEATAAFNTEQLEEFRGLAGRLNRDISQATHVEELLSDWERSGDLFDSGFWTNTEEAERQTLVNNLVGKMRNDDFTNELGRTDAPGDIDLGIYETTMPFAGATMFDKKAANTIRTQSEIFRKRTQWRLQMEVERLQRLGVEIPEDILALVDLPEGWSE